MRPRSLLPTIAATWIASVLFGLLAGCAALPSLEGRPESFAATATHDTRLGHGVGELTASHAGKTGIHPMPLGTDAFAARMVLASAAERAIDAQYYIWHGDQTGVLLFEALANAGRRGVRVRILLDDQNTKGIEDMIAALGAIPNLEVRLYNPLAHRGSARFLDYLGDFERVNRRMHNKVFIADNQVAILGGRNIGNEYFGAGIEVPFMDLDVIAVGPAVRDASSEFDLYWNSASAYPAAGIVGPPPAQATAMLDERFAAARADPDSLAYIEAVRRTSLLQELLERRLEIEWTSARLVRDDPAKTLAATAQPDSLLLSQLLEGYARARVSLDIISPYFVPAEKGTAFLAGLARSGVRIRVLTNSYAATDVSVVHSGYAKRRCELARAGVRLYELKPSIVAAAAAKGKPESGSSAARLHAKTFAADGERIFVGSFNFDPRSALLNTEMGLVVESRVLAQRLSSIFELKIPESAYEVRATPGGDCIEWIEKTPSGEIRHATEPNTGWGKRLWLEFLATLPIDWLL